MTSLRTLCEDYLAFHRSLGAKLIMTRGLLFQFIAFLAQHEAPFITAALALEWASKPESVQQEWRARRLSEVRQFARYVHAVDPRHEVPPQRLLPYRRQRPQPYIYSDGEIEDLIGAARDLSGRLRPRTCSTMLGLLAITGMRSGEVVRLDRDDVDLRQGVLTIRESKFGKSRLNLCHDTTVQALSDYAAWRDERCPRPQSPAFFLNERAKRIDKGNFRSTFKTLTCQTGLRDPAASRGPRLHDLRHTFSVRTLIRWYRDDVDIDRHLPRLSTWLGHASVVDTYWYLTAVPELMALAARRLDERQGRHSS